MTNTAIMVLMMSVFLAAGVVAVSGEDRGPYLAALSVLDQQGEYETTSLIVPNQCRNTHTTTTTSSTISSSTREPRCDTHPARCDRGDWDAHW